MKNNIFTISKEVKRYYDSNVESVWFELPEGKLRMPISEISPYRLNDKDESNLYSEIKGRFKAKKLQLANGEVILSRRLAILDEYRNLEVGEFKNGVIKRIMSFGIFIKIEGGIEGLCNVVEVSDARMDDLNTFFKVGQEIRVKVMRIQTYYPYHVDFSIKQASKNLFIDLDEVVTARITRLLDNKSGAFVEISPLSTGIVDAIPGEFELDEQSLGMEIYALVRGVKKTPGKDGIGIVRRYKLDYLETCI